MKKYIVFDSETTNSIDDPFCYDIGFIVIDETGKKVALPLEDFFK